jgi:glycosyltransferase involved in cell wall biosynthesis
MSAVPEVSVVIPTRNRWGFLSRTLEAVLRQEDVTFEVIVVDDGSTDETPQRLDAIEDPRLTVLRNDAGSGVARARNRGMSHATGAWIAWVDDDDFWAPRKLRTQIDAAVAAGADFVWAEALVISPDGRLVGFEPAPEPADFAGRMRWRNPMPGGCSNAIARAETVRAAGGFDESLHVVADWDYWIRLLDHGRGAVVHEPLLAYVVHTENMVLRESADVLDEFERFASKHEDGGARFDRAAFCDWIAKGLRRAGRRREAARLFLRVAIAERSLKSLGLAIRVLLGEWAVELPRRRWKPVIPPRPEWLDAIP